MENGLQRDAKYIDFLTEFYIEDISKVLVHSRTGAPKPIPESLVERASLLNLLLFQPEFVLMFGGSLAFSHLDVYRPFFQRSNRRFAILASDLKGKTRQAINIADKHVYLRSQEHDPTSHFSAVKNLTGLLYVSHKPYNYRCISRVKNAIHCYSGHGFSDKHTAEFRLASAYDYVMRPDTVGTQRFSAADIPLDPSRFLLIGGLPVEGLRYEPEPRKLKNVLYAPTWEGHDEEVNFSSVFDVTDRFQEFISGSGNLSFRPHPALGKKRKHVDDAKKKILKIAHKAEQKADAFNASDILISDISGVLPEYLFTGKPIIIPVPADSWKRGYIKKTDLENYCYIWDPKATSLRDFLARISDDPKREARLAKRHQRFLGSQNLDDLCSHFDSALNLMEQANQQRTLKAISSGAGSIGSDADFDSLPDGSEMRKIVSEIKSGRRILGED